MQYTLGTITLEETAMAVLDHQFNIRLNGADLDKQKRIIKEIYTRIANVNNTVINGTTVRLILFVKANGQVATGSDAIKLINDAETNLQAWVLSNRFIFKWMFSHASDFGAISSNFEEVSPGVYDWSKRRSFNKEFDDELAKAKERKLIRQNKPTLFKTIKKVGKAAYETISDNSTAIVSLTAIGLLALKVTSDHNQVINQMNVIKKSIGNIELPPVEVIVNTVGDVLDIDLY